MLLFVFRDRTRTPLEKLIETWEADLQRMWDGIAKPPQYEQHGIHDFFELQVGAWAGDPAQRPAQPLGTPLPYLAGCWFPCALGCAPSPSCPLPNPCAASSPPNHPPPPSSTLP